VRRALISVYDKTGLLPLAHALADAGVEIVSTGSTASRIAEAGLAQHEHGPVLVAPQVVGELEALRLSPGERRRGLSQGQVPKTQFAEHPEA